MPSSSQGSTGKSQENRYDQVRIMSLSNTTTNFGIFSHSYSKETLDISIQLFSPMKCNIESILSLVQSSPVCALVDAKWVHSRSVAMLQ